MAANGCVAARNQTARNCGLLIFDWQNFIARLIFLAGYENIGFNR